MPRRTYNGVVVEVSDETATRLSSDYKPEAENSTDKAPAKKAASARKSSK